jgi:hypothetical protein
LSVAGQALIDGARSTSKASSVIDRPQSLAMTSRCAAVSMVDRNVVREKSDGSLRVGPILRQS